MEAERTAPLRDILFMSGPWSGRSLRSREAGLSTITAEFLFKALGAFLWRKAMVAPVRRMALWRQDAIHGIRTVRGAWLRLCQAAIGGCRASLRYAGFGWFWSRRRISPHPKACGFRAVFRGGMQARLRGFGGFGLPVAGARYSLHRRSERVAEPGKMKPSHGEAQYARGRCLSGWRVEVWSGTRARPGRASIGRRARRFRSWSRLR